jgi:hypothetical protein
MNTLAVEITDEIQATHVQFSGQLMIVHLSDGRVISLPIDKIDWLRWLAEASPEQQANWSLEPGGFAIYWDDLDDGVELIHLLSFYSLI